jgi:hypothetical protein
VNGESPYPRWQIRGALELTKTCPRGSVSGESTQWLELFHHYKAGHLLRDGGIADQPARYVAAMRLIDITLRNIDG